MMPVVILCGGRGLRMDARPNSNPKPLVPIGGRPILWHIMKHFAHYGHTRFVLALGHRALRIKRYFVDALWNSGDVTVDLTQGRVEAHRPREPWRVTLVETGADTPTGGRLLRLAPYLEQDERFFLTYGDGVSDVNLDALLAYHQAHATVATVTGVRRAIPFGVLHTDRGRAVRFSEKPELELLINGGYFVFERRVFEYLEPDSVLEQAPLQRLAAEGNLAVFEHNGFWACMDTPKDAIWLNRLWKQGAPWNVWDR